MTITISRFWREFAAGKPLGPAWARKDAQIVRDDPELLDELPQAAWMCLGEHEQRRLLHCAVAVEA